MTASLLENFLGICHHPKRCDSTEWLQRSCVFFWALISCVRLTGQRRTHSDWFVLHLHPTFSLQHICERAVERDDWGIWPQGKLCQVCYSPLCREDQPWDMCDSQSVVFHGSDYGWEGTGLCSWNLKVLLWSWQVVSMKSVSQKTPSLSSWWGWGLFCCFFRGFRPFLEGWKGPGSLPVWYFICCSAHSRAGGVVKILLIL